MKWFDLIYLLQVLLSTGSQLPALFSSFPQCLRQGIVLYEL